MLVHDYGSPEEEGRNLAYTGNCIPWYLRAIWIAFWVFAISYVIVYLLPALQQEIVSPPP